MAKKKKATAKKEVTLPGLLGAMHQIVATELGIARAVIHHPGTKGTLSEDKWIKVLQDHLPERYQVNRAFVIDSKGKSSQQIDVVVHDRQYSPFVLKFDSALYVPAESVYAVLEVKQNLDGDQIKYAAEKIESVRKLHRTSLPIPHAGGEHPPKPLHHILGGLITLESDWTPAFGKAFQSAIRTAPAGGRLDLGCAIKDGVFEITYGPTGPNICAHRSSATLASFLLQFIFRLQAVATVPRIDVQAYAASLNPCRL